jgi:hypothetical protein
VLALYVIAGIVLFIVLVLSIPVDMTLDLEATERAGTKMRVGWLFGLFWKDIRGRRRKKKPVKKGRKGFMSFLSVLRVRGLPEGILRLARRVFGRIKVGRMDVDIRLGLDDPADTGMMYSVLWPVLVPVNPFGPMNFRLEPVFEEPTFEASLHGRVRVYPIQMVGSLLRFVFSPTGLRAIKAMAVSRWKRKK